jgi:hypothetical protein
MGFNTLNTHQYMLNLGWKNIHPADNQHIIGAAGNFFHAHKCPAADTGLGN